MALVRCHQSMQCLFDKRAEFFCESMRSLISTMVGRISVIMTPREHAKGVSCPYLSSEPFNPCPSTVFVTDRKLLCQTMLSQIRSNQPSKRERAAARRKKCACSTRHLAACDLDCGMFSFHPSGECTRPITHAGSFYLRTEACRSKRSGSAAAIETVAKCLQKD